MMQTEKFLAKNVNCGGGATTIREGGVTVSGETLNWTVLAQKLDELGDPEAA